MDKWKLFAALGLSIFGNCIAWFHMNAQFRWIGLKVCGGFYLVVYPLVLHFFIPPNFFMNTSIPIGV